MSTKKADAVDAALVPYQTHKELAPLSELDQMFGDTGAEGLENVRSSDIILPRLAILQPVSDLANEEGYRAGDLYNTISQENLGRSLEFYPIRFWETRIHWLDPTIQGGPIDCSSLDGVQGAMHDPAHAGGVCARCPFAQWSDDGKGPRCTAFKNVLLIPTSADASPLVYSGKRKAEKPVRQMISAAMVLRRNGKPVPLYASSWTLTTVKEQNDKGIFFVPKFTRNGYITDVAKFTELRDLYTSMKAAQERIVVAPDVEETEGTTYEGASDF